MLLDLPTREEIQALGAKLDQVLTLVSAPAAAPDRLMTLDEVAAYVQFDRRTVRKWVTDGQFNAQGRRIYLPAQSYAELLRFRRADVDAFGLGIGVLTPAVAGPQPTKKILKKRAPLPSEAALKVA